MQAARLPALLLGLLLAVPAAGALAQPAFYFLTDAPGPLDDAVPPLPVPVPLPVSIPTLPNVPGVLEPYDPVARNVPNATAAKSRLVTPGTETVVPVQFVTPGNHSHPDRIRGILFVGLWLGESSIAYGNLNATLYEVPADGSAAIALAGTSIPLDLNASKAPDPAALIPPNSTDPQAILFYELAQVMPLLLRPPALLTFGPVDIAFSNESAFAIGFRLEQGSSPVPLPAGAFATVQYDGAFQPSFAYVPWYAPDPPRPTSTVTRTSTSSGSSTRSSTSGPTTDQVVTGDDDKDTPGLAVPMLAGLLAVAALAARRRLK
jgi:MYXO-CTERM domain-containing protein